MKPTEWIWRDGALVKWSDATVHVSAHALHYGSSVFEGIRAYATKQGVQIFRLRDHIVRLVDSARVYGMPLAFDVAAIERACKDVVRANKLPHAYVRPLVFRGSPPSVDSAMLHMADEAFLTGTAAEITGIRSVDRIQVGDGKVGPVTRALQKAFYGLFDGSTQDRRGWLDPVGA